MANIIKSPSGFDLGTIQDFCNNSISQKQFAGFEFLLKGSIRVRGRIVKWGLGSFEVYKEDMKTFDIKPENVISIEACEELTTEEVLNSLKEVQIKTLLRSKFPMVYNGYDSEALAKIVEDCMQWAAQNGRKLTCFWMSGTQMKPFTKISAESGSRIKFDDTELFLDHVAHIELKLGAEGSAPVSNNFNNAMNTLSMNQQAGNNSVQDDVVSDWESYIEKKLESLKGSIVAVTLANGEKVTGNNFSVKNIGNIKVLTLKAASSYGAKETFNSHDIKVKEIVMVSYYSNEQNTSGEKSADSFFS